MDEHLRSDRVEAEIKLHEKEMMKKAMLKKLANAPLKERIKFIIEHEEKEKWKVEDMISELNHDGLSEGVDEAEVEKILKEDYPGKFLAE